MKPVIVYLVVGSTGEYSDYTQWNVCCYGDREQADLHAAALNRAVTGVGGTGSSADTEKRVRETLDPNCLIDYTGAKYRVEEVRLFRHFDEFQGLEG